MRSLVVLLVCFLWSATATAEASRVVIGSKPFTESRLLGEILAQLVERDTSLKVERRFGLGGTQVAFGALQNGDIDLYPEYTGTVWTVLLKKKGRVNDSLRAFLISQRELHRRLGLELLAPFGFNNSYALAMAGDKARALGITRVSDLLSHPTLAAGVSHEFLERPDGFPGLQNAYKLKLGAVNGMEHGLAYEALRTGKIDLVDTYTTDGKLLRYDVVVLEDDRRFFPPYDAAPLARRDLFERHPELRDVLGKLAFTIDDARMRRLNHQAEQSGGRFGDVARAFLDELAGGGPKQAGTAAASTEPRGFFAYLWQSRAKLGRRTAEHLGLTLVAVLLAIFLSVPLGIYLTRHAKAAPAVLGAAGVIQTVPSLALLAFMIPVPGLGLGVRSAVAALFLYALLPILRNSYTGIVEVDPDLLEAARAIGLTDRQVLCHVELPLAMRTIMAGIRTATVISVGVATLAAFVGAGGLGDPIVTGLQLDDVNLVLSGAVPAALLAVMVDALLGRLERALVPAGLAAGLG